MKIVKNKYIPYVGFCALYFFGLLFVRECCRITERLLRHESIHHEQAKEMLFVGFYVWYLVEWVVRVAVQLCGGPSAYYSISFEREAYSNEDDVDYLHTRKHYAWMHYIFE